MNDYNQKYFFLDYAEVGIYPSVQYSIYEPHSSMELLREKVLDETTRSLSFTKHSSKDGKLGDYHFLDEHAPAISERMKNILESFNLNDVQFIPAVILDHDENKYEGYYIIRVHNLIKCMDKDKSVWTPSQKKPGKARSIDKLVLDNEVLDKIPLEDRLVFAIWENSLKVCYHYSVVEKLLELEPKGMSVYQLAKWDPSAPFKGEYLARMFGDK
ncbi:MAG: imm11 family protein [Dysgonomonas sp.]